MNFQLMQRDEFGTTSIIAAGKDIKKLIVEAKKNLQDMNINNALASEEKERNWEGYMVEFIADIPSDEENT
jgi:hypothetical protein